MVEIIKQFWNLRKENKKMNIKPMLTKLGWNEIDGDFVVYNPIDEKYFVLNESASDIWKILIQKDELEFQELKEQFIATYEVDESEINNDLLDVLTNMEQLGLLELEVV